MNANTEQAVARISRHSDSQFTVIERDTRDLIVFITKTDAHNAQRILHEFGQDVPSVEGRPMVLEVNA